LQSQTALHYVDFVNKHMRMIVNIDS